MYVCAKPFKTISRKFTVGDPVTAADVQDGPLALHDWMAGGFIEAAPSAAEPPADPSAE